MSREPDPRRLDRESEVDAELRRALAHLGRPAARPEFRAALREQFLSGTAAHDAARASRAGPGAHATAPPPKPRRLFLLVGALAAAAAVVTVLALTKSRPPLWRIHPSSTAESVIVDGIPLRLDDGEKLVSALGVARELEVRGGTLRVAVRDEAWIEVADGTRLSQMKFAAAGPYHVRTDRGSLGIATLPAFSGRGLRVLTEDFDLQVTGTIFGVDVDGEGSCLCVLEGTVQCRPAGSAGSRPVAGGDLCFSYRDRRPPSWNAAHEAHLSPLRALRP